MPRISRMINTAEKTVYHVISRTVLESKRVIDKKIVQKEREKGFEFSGTDMFINKTRYFTDSGVIGNKEFVSDNYQKFKHLFQSKNEKKPKSVKGFDGLYSLKRLVV